jgi:homoserine dehydrogenase
MSVEDFLDCGVLLLDEDIQERVNKASLNGHVLRYVCVIEGSR